MTAEMIRKRRIVILGDSHTEAIKAGLAKRPDMREFHFSVHRISKSTEKGEIGDTSLPEALKLISSLSPEDIVVVCLLGTAHNIFGLVEHDEPFDVFFNAMPDPSGTPIVPQKALRDLFVNVLSQERTLGKIRDVAPGPVFHLSTPPPKADNDFILDKLRNYRGHKVNRITLADTRLKMWAIENEVLDEFCKKRGIWLVLPPKEVISPRGFLKREYYGSDATHANADYGILILEQLERLAFENSAPPRNPDNERAPLQTVT